MKLVNNWREARKWLSMKIPAANAAFLLTWSQLPQKFQDALPLPWVIGIAVLLLLAGMFGRVVDQTPKEKS